MRIILISILFIQTFASCNTTKRSSNNIKKSQQQLIYKDSTTATQLRSGIDFIAYGDKPVSWKLEMDYEKDFTLYVSNQKIIKGKPVIPTKIADVAGETYFTKNNNQRFNISIFKEKCEVGLSKEIFSKKVYVETIDTTYEGCGNYIIDYRLNDTWLLDYIDNEEQFALNYHNKIPTLTFNLIKNKMKGFNGCNNIESNIEIKGNRIQFSTFFSNLITCENDNAALLMNEYLSTHLVEYFFRDDKLVLQLANDTRLRFSKKED